MSAAHLPPRPSDPVGRRSTGIHRVHTVTRWAVVGSAASAVVLGLGYAHALPRVASLVPSHASGDTGGQGGGGGNGGVQAPGASDQGSAPSHTVTGSS